MIVDSIICYLAVHVYIEWVIKENVESQWSKNRAWRNSTVYSCPFATCARYLNCMSPVSQVINYNIASILRQAIGMKPCDEKGMWHSIICSGGNQATDLT